MPDAIRLRLFVAGEAGHSQRALANLATICATHFGGQCDIDVVDVFAEPLRALEGGILLTPQLVVLSAVPERRIVGDLSDTDAVVLALGGAVSQA